MSVILPRGEAFLHAGGPVGCLVIHGFTGAPAEMRWFGAQMAQAGYSVVGVRLFAHATQPEDMFRARPRDWVASVEDGYHLLRGLSEQVVVMGLSLGGILSLHFASRFEVRGVVAMSVPYVLMAPWSAAHASAPPGPQQGDALLGQRRARLARPSSGRRPP